VGTFLVACCVLLIVPSSASQVEHPKAGATERVTTAPIAPVKVAAGKSATVDLPFRVTRGYHINSNKPNSELLIATALKVSPPTNIEIAKLAYPSGQDRSFPFSPAEKLNVYTGDFAVTGLVRAARNTPPGTYRVRGMLKYQACDDRACYPPGQLPVTFDVKVTKGVSTRKHRGNPAQSPHVHQ
jgi:hypothetical protein